MSTCYYCGRNECSCWRGEAGPDVPHSHIEETSPPSWQELAEIAFRQRAELRAEIEYRRATEALLRADLAAALEVVKAAEAWAYDESVPSRDLEKALVAAVDVYRTKGDA